MSKGEIIGAIIGWMVLMVIWIITKGGPLRDVGIFSDENDDSDDPEAK